LQGGARPFFLTIMANEAVGAQRVYSLVYYGPSVELTTLACNDEVKNAWNFLQSSCTP